MWPNSRHNSLHEYSHWQATKKISEAQSKGEDISSLETSLNDLITKSTDAQTQAQNAANSVATLTPDQGDKTIFASNNQVMHTARGDIKTASQDLIIAGSDAQNIITSLKLM